MAHPRPVPILVVPKPVLELRIARLLARGIRVSTVVCVMIVNVLVVMGMGSIARRALQLEMLKVQAHVHVKRRMDEGIRTIYVRHVGIDVIRETGEV